MTMPACSRSKVISISRPCLVAVSPYKAAPKLTIAADVSRILYGDVDAIANEGPTANEFFGAFCWSPDR